MITIPRVFSLSGSRARIALIICMLAVVLCSPPLKGEKRASTPFAVRNVAFAPFIDAENKMPNQPFVPGSVARTSRVCLWTEIIGGEEALKFLGDKGRLPLRHHWMRVVADTYEEMPNAEFGEHWTNAPPEVSEHASNPEHSQSIKVGTVHDLPRLQAEVDVARVFDWRTWSYCNNLEPGTYRVDVTTNDGEILPLGDGKCTLWIRVAP